MNNKTFAISTLGCKVNSYESDCIASLLSEAGFTRTAFSQKADIYIINTCSVTNTGDKKSRQAIHRARRQNPDAFIAVLGCYAQANPEEAKSSGADLVSGTKNRLEFVQKILKGTIGTFVCDASERCDFEELNLKNSSERTRAYIKIQDGCDNFCSYCIIPYTRGRVRSRSVESTITEALRIKNAGYKEIVFTGIEVYSYGKGTDHDLIGLIEKIDKEVAPARIRLSSIDPRAFTDGFIKRLSEIPSLCHYFHISAQSGCVETLKRMNRHYTPEEFLSAVNKIREYMPDSGIGTDIITGFPGETEEEFRKTCEFVKNACFSRLHVFPYSERKGTKAAEMEQLPVSLRAERAKELIRIGEKLSADFSEAYVGKKLSVLFETKKGCTYEGYSENYLRVFAKSSFDLCGEIKTVKITGCSNDRLTGTIVDN